MLWTYTLLLPNFSPGGMSGAATLGASGSLRFLYEWSLLAHMSPVTSGALLALTGNVAVLVGRVADCAADVAARPHGRHPVRAPVHMPVPGPADTGR